MWSAPLDAVLYALHGLTSFSKLHPVSVGADPEGLGSVSSSAMDLPFDFGHVALHPQAFILFTGGELGDGDANFCLFLCILPILVDSSWPEEFKT